MQDFYKERDQKIAVDIFFTILSFSSQKDTELFTSVLTQFSVGYSSKLSRACKAQ